jgi:hypothetical protein
MVTCVEGEAWKGRTHIYYLRCHFFSVDHDWGMVVELRGESNASREFGQKAGGATEVSVLQAYCREAEAFRHKDIGTQPPRHEWCLRTN